MTIILDEHSDPGIPWNYEQWHNVEGVGLRVDDEQRPASADNIDSASTRYRYDHDEALIEFDDDARLTHERIAYTFQMKHAWLEQSKVGPHLHWHQLAADIPNWWIKYRAYNNGEARPAWTEVPWDSNVFTWSSGEILQVTTFPDIDLTGITISGFLDVIFGRDTGNASTLFSGLDPLTGVALFKEFDLHAIFDSRGSRQEFVK